VRTISYFSPKPKQKPKRLPRRRPIKVVPSGIGDEGIVGNWLCYYLKGGDYLHDFSPENNHGTINGAKWKDGRYGWGLDFDGVDDYVEIPNTASLDLSTFTVCLWAKIEDATADRTLVDKGWNIAPSFTLWYQNGIGLGGAIKNSAGDYTSEYPYTVTEGEWFFFSCVYDGTDLILYKNSTSKSYSAVSVSSFANNWNITFGWMQQFGKYLEGVEGQVRIYNVAKSSSWISRRFERTKGIFGI